MAEVKISELAEALPLDGTEDLPLVQDAITKRTSTQDIANLAIKCKVWRGLISQAGTANPTITELENTLGGDVTVSRSVAGLYTIAGAALFTTNKTFASPKWETLRQAASYATVSVVYSNDSQITLSTYLNGVLADDILSSHPIEILVYP